MELKPRWIDGLRQWQIRYTVQLSCPCWLQRATIFGHVLCSVVLNNYTFLFSLFLKLYLLLGA